MKPRQETIVIVNKLGLHTRPSAAFVKLANQFHSDVSLIFNDVEVNGKSILSILMLAAGKGSKITLKVSGEDQDAAFTALKNLVLSGFGE